MIQVPIYIPPIQVPEHVMNQLTKEDAIVKLFLIEWVNKKHSGELQEWPFLCSVLRTIIKKHGDIPLVFVRRDYLTNFSEAIARSRHPGPREAQYNSAVEKIGGKEVQVTGLDIVFRFMNHEDKHTQLSWETRFIHDYPAELAAYKQINKDSVITTHVWMETNIEVVKSMLQKQGFQEGSVDTAEISANVAEWLIEE